VHSSYAVLIVTRDLTFQSTCVEMLRGQGQFVVTAAGCRDALLFGREFQLDVIVCDVRSVDDCSVAASSGNGPEAHMCR
jgi:CheY-like chemotaxis protein